MRWMYSSIAWVVLLVPIVEAARGDVSALFIVGALCPLALVVGAIMSFFYRAAWMLSNGPRPNNPQHPNFMREAVMDVTNLQTLPFRQLWTIAISVKRRIPASPRRLLDLVGYLFPRKLRDEIFKNAADDLTQDWLEARRGGYSRWWLYPVFLIRIVCLVIGTVIVGVERGIRKVPLLAAAVFNPFKK